MFCLQQEDNLNLTVDNTLLAQGALEPALSVLERNKGRENMLHSALVDLFNAIAHDDSATL